MNIDHLRGPTARDITINMVFGALKDLSKSRPGFYFSKECVASQVSLNNGGRGFSETKRYGVVKDILETLIRDDAERIERIQTLRGETTAQEVSRQDERYPLYGYRIKSCSERRKTP